MGSKRQKEVSVVLFIALCPYQVYKHEDSWTQKKKDDIVNQLPLFLHSSYTIPQVSTLNIKT